MTFSWIAALSDLADRKIPCVLITVVESKGSTPRDAGTKMVVSADAQFGTIGGGNLEFQAIKKAREFLAVGVSASEIKSYHLGPELEQCCGGLVRILLEPFFPQQKQILLFGAGHVGKEVIRVLEALPVQIRWIDSRAAEFPADIPRGCERVVAEDPVREIAMAPPGSFIVIMTHDHALDYALVRAALKKGSFTYLGLIGSATKRARFFKRLVAEGLDTALLTCPIGISGLKGKHPREIAISLAAQLLEKGLISAAQGHDASYLRQYAGAA